MKFKDPSAYLQVFFYGAGCSSAARCKVVSDALKTFFPASEINVDHDLLAAARSLCGRGEGIAAILGTGSNSCLYNGDRIIDNVPALGFILGDEGGGAYIGKQLVKAFLYRELSSELQKKFQDTYSLDKEIIFRKVYSEKLPNKFLASLAPFTVEHKNDEKINELILYSFRQFFEHHITKYSRFSEFAFNCVGSIGFNLNEQLRQVASEFNIKTGKIEKSPIEGLIQFHLQE
jgi:N-acetylglucosamine kinase-like BadF-type ATPase